MRYFSVDFKQCVVKYVLFEMKLMKIDIHSRLTLDLR